MPLSDFLCGNFTISVVLKILELNEFFLILIQWFFLAREKVHHSIVEQVTHRLRKAA